jgi:hypothetical protein
MTSTKGKPAKMVLGVKAICTGQCKAIIGLLPACKSPQSLVLRVRASEYMYGVLHSSLAAPTTSHEPKLPLGQNLYGSTAPMAVSASTRDPRRIAMDLRDAHRCLPLARFFASARIDYWCDVAVTAARLTSACLFQRSMPLSCPL